MTTSFWMDDLAAPRPALSGDLRAEALVLGAGMTGIGLAYYLAQRDVPCLVVERGTVASGASGRNLGLLFSGLGEHYARSIEFWGRREAAAITKLHLENQSLIDELASRNGIECEYRRTGSYSVAADAAEVEELSRSFSLMQEDGFPSVFLDAAEMNGALGGRGFLGGIYNSVDATVHPVRLLRGLAAAAERSGARIFENTPVTQVTRAGGQWIVRSDRGTAAAPRLFLACNAWLPLFRNSLPLRPVRGQCCALKAEGAALPEMACVSNYGAEYWRASGEYCLIGGFRRVGGAEENSRLDEVTEVVQRAVESFARSHFPSLECARVTHRWSGIMAFTPDGLPMVGRLPDEEGLYFSGGYTGHGFGYAFAAARRLVALAIDGRDEIPSLLRIDRVMRLSPALEEI